MSRHMRHERTFLGKVFWSVTFGLTCMFTIQIPLINALSVHMPEYAAMFIAFFASGIVDFHLNYFGTHGPSGWRMLKPRGTDWRHYGLSAARQFAASVFAGSINTCAQLILRALLPFVPQSLTVLMANAVSGIVGQSLKMTIVYRQQHPHKAQLARKTPKYRQIAIAVRQYIGDAKVYLHYFMQKKHKARSRGVNLPAGEAA